MTTYKLLWVDDEIELLKAHILFLEKKGYQVETVTNGYDALDRCAEEAFDLTIEGRADGLVLTEGSDGKKQALILLEVIANE